MNDIHFWQPMAKRAGWDLKFVPGPAQPAPAAQAPQADGTPGSPPAADPGGK